MKHRSLQKKTKVTKGDKGGRAELLLSRLQFEDEDEHDDENDSLSPRGPTVGDRNKRFEPQMYTDETQIFTEENEGNEAG